MSEATYTHLLVRSQGRVGVVQLNRPQVRNALNAALMAELIAALQAFDADGEIVLGHLNARLSPDGTRVAFVSSSNALAPGDNNSQPDVFVRDLATGATLLASSSSSGVPAQLQTCCFQSYYHVEWANNQVLQDGKVAEQGRHRDLLQRPESVYSWLWANQNKSGLPSTSSSTSTTANKTAK